MEYKNSVYNVFFSGGSEQYVYNMLSTAISEINTEIKQALSDGNLQAIPPEIQDELIKEGFMVEKGSNEADKYQYYYDSARFSRATDSLSIVFIPTYGCNLRCTYCYEGNDKNFKKISFADIDRIILFIKGRILASFDETPIREIQAQLYGGEPMTCKRELEYYCGELKKLADEYRLSVNFSMVSNFTLLDDPMADLISKYDITTQVSIDGTKKEHDLRRVRVDGSGTYDAIIANLSSIVNRGLKKNITIRINTDLDNIDEAESVFNEMLKYSSDVYFGVLTKYNGCNDAFSSDCLDSSVAGEILSKLTSRLYAKYNMDIPQHFGKKGPCALNCENKYMIDCNLDVYKCDLLINHKECRVGHIDERGNLELFDGFYSQMSFSPFKFEKCRCCKMLPMCGGGCPATEYLNRGKTDGDLNIASCAVSEESLRSCLIDYVDCCEGGSDEQ